MDRDAGAGGRADSFGRFVGRIAGFFKGPLDGKRFVDVSENSMYWYFVVWTWLPIYLTTYWGARAL